MGRMKKKESAASKKKDYFQRFFERLRLILAIVISIFAYLFNRAFPYLNERVILPISGVFILILVLFSILFFGPQKNKKIVCLFLVFMFFFFILMLFDQKPVTYFIVDFSDNMSEFVTKEFVNTLKLKTTAENQKSRIGLAMFGGGLSFNDECDDFFELVSPLGKNQDINNIHSTIDLLIEHVPSGKNLMQASIEKVLDEVNVFSGNHNIIVITAGQNNLCEPFDREEIDEKSQKLFANFSIIINSLGNLSKQELDMYDSFADFHKNIYSDEEIKELGEYLVTGFCGDGRCDDSESCFTCSLDCESCPACIKNNGSYEVPCLFEPNQGKFNNFSSIAKEVYGNEQFAGRIAELYRDEEGLIIPISIYIDMMVPDLDIPRTLEYFSSYFKEESQVGITQCAETNLRFPCFIELEENETYGSLADKYYQSNNESIVKRIKIANDTEYFFNEEKGLPDLQPISKLTKGTIVILPTTP